MTFWRHLRGFLRLGGQQEQPGALVAVRTREAPTQELAMAAADCPLPLAEMYVDVLRGHGIPAMIRMTGAGRGALGGAPMEAQVMVPAAALQRAREVLGSDDAGPSAGETSDDEQSDERDERKDGEIR